MKIGFLWTNIALTIFWYKTIKFNPIEVRKRIKEVKRDAKAWVRNETNVYDIGKYYSIYPSYVVIKSKNQKKKLEESFMMNSGTYHQKLNKKQLIKKISHNIKNFNF